MLERWNDYYQFHATTKKHHTAVSHSKNVIDDFLTVTKRPYVAFSGGKDSTAILILLSQMGCTDIPVFTQADDLDFPEKEQLCHSVINHLGFTDYAYRFSKVSAIEQLAQADAISGEDISGTFSHVIEQWRQERDRDGAAIGLRIEESKGRKNQIVGKGELFRMKNGLWRCYPVSRMKGEDVFALIIKANVPYASIYTCDECKPPHTARFSWMVSPDFFSKGQVVFLKKHYPEQFQKLCSINPILRTYV